MAAIEELYALLGWKLTGEDNLKRFQSNMKRVEQQLDAFVSRAGTFAVALGTVVGGGMAAFGKSVIATSAQFEGFEAALTTIEGSAEKARTSMDWISDFAKKTPYEVAGLTDAFIKLRTYGIDPIADDTLRTLGDAASAMNKPLEQAVEALADATTFQFERLREFGITVEQKGKQVTFSYQKNGKQVQETVEKSGEAVRKWVLDNLGDRFNGAMIRQSKTWNGMMSNLGDSWEDFKLRTGRGGFFDTVKGHLGDLLDYIDKLDKDGTLDHWSKQLGLGLTWAVEQGKHQIKLLVKDFEFLRDWAKNNPDMFGYLIEAIKVLGAVIFPKTFALLVLQDIFRWIQGRGSYIGDLAAELEKLTGIDAGTLGSGLAGIAFAGAGLLFAVGPVKALSAAVSGLASALGLLAGGQAAAGAGVLTKIGAAARAAGAFFMRGANPYAIAGAVTYGALNDVPHDAMAAAVKENPDLLNRLDAEKRRWGGVHFEGGRHRAGLGAGPTSGDAIKNFLDHSRYINGGGPARAATQGVQAVTDNRNQSVKVDVGGVVVNGVQDASAAVGAKVGAAVGGLAARAGGTRFEKDDMI
ncbi:tape measure protein [Shinella sp. JR1-6]|uniref:tape measure protein n=1 Tax=Shinella sp. JR1-6 TaxID=2527671 RepID=UPI00102D46D0|nr:tape measure protein [Shinella sp. JR1-6]TAA61873.1 hypothetical protein EXZ48_12175 [Shinella sp. JR1-6]